jgi:hypothetical protein
MSVDNYLELCERSIAAGIKEGESMAPILDQMINEGVIKRVVKTERSEKEIVMDLKKHWRVWEKDNG